MWLQVDCEKVACSQRESRNRKAGCGTLQPWLGVGAEGDSDFLPRWACPQWPARHCENGFWVIIKF